MKGLDATLRTPCENRRERGPTSYMEMKIKTLMKQSIFQKAASMWEIKWKWKFKNRVSPVGLIEWNLMIKWNDIVKSGISSLATLFALKMQEWITSRAWLWSLSWVAPMPKFQKQIDSKMETKVSAEIVLPTQLMKILARKIYSTVISLTNQEIAILVWDEGYGLHSEVATE